MVPGCGESITMSPEAQRIVIAEACGWNQRLWDKDSRQRPTTPALKWFGPSGHESRRPSYLPDYLNDLNAMHEAEKTLRDYAIGVYQDWINRIVPNSPEYVGGLFAVIHASAAQRTEAFLRTLGKWID